jgi:hypothetical protein
MTKWIFDPRLPRSTGFGPVSSPLWPARTLTVSIAHRDQSSSPREPVSVARRSRATGSVSGSCSEAGSGRSEVVLGLGEFLFGGGEFVGQFGWPL